MEDICLIRRFFICAALKTRWIRWAMHVARVEVKRTATRGSGAAT